MNIPEKYQDIICRHQKDLENIPDEWLRLVGMGGYNREAGRRDAKVKMNDLVHLEESFMRLSKVVDGIHEKIKKAGL